MPQKVPEVEIDNLLTFSEYLHNRHASGDRPMWYRGCGRASYILTPSLYRHPANYPIEKLLKLEKQITSRFRQRSVPFHNRPLSDDWECLFFMQHFGVPTRLLDWTENPHVGLYFALTSAYRGESGSVIENAALWVLDPGKWNEKSLAHLGFNRGPLSPQDEELTGYVPATDINLMNNTPVALFGTHNSSRIVAQRGVFVIFGKALEPMEKLYSTLEYPQGSLEKLIIQADIVDDLLNELIRFGYTDSTVFPDLDGLSREIRRFFGFGG